MSSALAMKLIKVLVIALLVYAGAMTALVSGAASSRESDSTSAAALPVASLMVEVGDS